jgi:hypothetical protein
MPVLFTGCNDVPPYRIDFLKMFNLQHAGAGNGRHNRGRRRLERTRTHIGPPIARSAPQSETLATRRSNQESGWEWSTAHLLSH